MIHLTASQPRMFILYFICKLDDHARIPDIKNSTEEDHDQDVEGIRRAAQLPANIFLNSNQPCFTQFFLHGQPPIGLRTANLQHMRYICQERQPPGVYYYASMHDQARGIPVYSGYRLHRGNIAFQAQHVDGWIQTPGNIFTCTKKKKRG